MTRKRFLVVVTMLAAMVLADAAVFAATGYEYAAKAEVARKAGRYAEAIDLYTKAISAGDLSKPSLAVIHLNRGATYEFRGETDRALGDFTKAIGLKPDYQEAFHNRGAVWAKKGEIDRALADYTRALELNPKDWLTYYNRGLAWYKKGDFKRSVSDYTDAIRINPTYAAAYGGRALAWDQMGDPHQGLVDARKAFELDPSPDAQKRLDYLIKRTSPE